MRELTGISTKIDDNLPEPCYVTEHYLHLRTLILEYQLQILRRGRFGYKLKRTFDAVTKRERDF